MKVKEFEEKFNYSSKEIEGSSNKPCGPCSPSCEWEAQGCGECQTGCQTCQCYREGCAGQTHLYIVFLSI